MNIKITLEDNQMAERKTSQYDKPDTKTPARLKALNRVIHLITKLGHKVRPEARTGPNFYSNERKDPIRRVHIWVIVRESANINSSAVLSLYRPSPLFRKLSLEQEFIPAINACRTTLKWATRNIHYTNVCMRRIVDGSQYFFKQKI